MTRTNKADTMSVEKAITDIRQVLSVLAANGLNSPMYNDFFGAFFSDICKINKVDEKRIRKISGIRKSSITDAEAVASESEDVVPMLDEGLYNENIQ